MKMKAISGLTYKDWIRNILDIEDRATMKSIRLKEKLWDDAIKILRNERRKEMKYKYKGIRININDNKNGLVRLIVYLKEEGGPYYKTYFFKAIDREYESRDEMMGKLLEYLEWKIKELKL